MNKIFVFTPYFRPAFKAGGPIKTIENILSNLQCDFDFFLFTGDRDIGDKSSFKNFKINRWLCKNKYQIYYSSKDQRSFKNLILQIREYNPDIIYLNSFFSLEFSIKIILLKKLNLIKSKIVIAPRGEFSPGALELKKSKKKIYITISKLFNLYKNVIWHSTSFIENEHIKLIFGKNIIVKDAPNLGDTKLLNKNFIIPFKNVGELKVVFLSRIVRKKNLEFIFKTLAKGNFEGEIIFDFYGSIEDKAYFNKCINLKNIISKNIKIEYKGIILPDKVLSTLNNYHLFFFPTKGENFGHVILEAFSAGLPILISDQTPWRNLNSQKLGWDINLDEIDKFISAINTALYWDNNTFINYSSNALQFAKLIMEKDDIKNKYFNLFC